MNITIGHTEPLIVYRQVLHRSSIERVGSLLSLSLLIPLGLHRRLHFIRPEIRNSIRYATSVFWALRRFSVPTSSELSESHHIFGQHRQHCAYMWPYFLSSHMIRHPSSCRWCGFSSRTAKCFRFRYHMADETTNSPTRYAEDPSPSSLSFPPILPTICHFQPPRLPR